MVVPGLVGRKGGRALCSEALPKREDELAKSLVGVAEALGNVLLGMVIDEDGTEGFVLALPRTVRLEEEATEGGIVHSQQRLCEGIKQGKPQIRLGAHQRES